MATSDLEKPVKIEKTQFFLMGFDQKAGVRLYAFQGLVHGNRTDYTVEVELSLIQAFGIRIQDLPLLCRELLERRELDPEHTLVLTARDMRVHADVCTAARDAAALKRKTPRKPPAENNGAAWRGIQLR